MTLSIVTFKWRPLPGYRSSYGPAQVNTLRRMVERHYRSPHRFVCVTDDAEGLDPEVHVVPLWNDLADLPNPSFRDGPSCYRRLKVFARDAGLLLGERFVCMDLDVVITGDLAPLFDRPEPFVSWRNPNPMWPINGSLFMLQAGAHPEVWERFDPVTSPPLAHGAGCRGSDQGWMSYVLGRQQPTWGREHGVWSWQDEITRRGRLHAPYKLPPGARVVIFHGPLDPWNPRAAKLAPWIREHYQ